MENFSTTVESLMQLDKKVLAELLALYIYSNHNMPSPVPTYYPVYPYFCPPAPSVSPYPYYTTTTTNKLS